MTKLLWLVCSAVLLSAVACGPSPEDQQVETSVQGGAAQKGGPQSQGAPPVGLNPNAPNPDSHVGSRMGDK